MKIENEFTVTADIERAWTLLTDIPAIAPCLPGAELRERDGDDYHGVMKVKVGPVGAEYHGTATVVTRDEATHTVHLSARGRDTRGAGNASADIVATMAPAGDGTVVSIATDLTVSGKFAQFGRGVMADVSKKLLGEFAACIEGSLSAGGSEDEDDEAAAAGDPEPTPPRPTAPLDVVDVAGAALAKRVAVVVVLAALVAFLLRRRR